jgi:catechol 2,3-dioxygenase-like lactoylglutathione lyase family enzyme
MFDHIGIFVSDFEKSIRFYEACFAPLGIAISERYPEFGAVIFSGEKMFPFCGLEPPREITMGKI